MYRLCRVSVLLMLTVLVQCVLGPSFSAASEERFKTYDNERAGFSLVYPAAWSSREEAEGTTFLAMAPVEGQRDSFSENVNVVIENLEGMGVSLPEYVEYALSQLEEEIPDFKLISKEWAMLNELHAVIWVFTGTEAHHSLKWMQACIVHDEQAYVLTYTAEQTRFGASLPGAISMFASFRVY